MIHLILLNQSSSDDANASCANGSEIANCALSNGSGSFGLGLTGRLAGCKRGLVPCNCMLELVGPLGQGSNYKSGRREWELCSGGLLIG